MEFERALFRIHQRAILSDSVRKVRLRAERILPWCVAGLSVLLLPLHSSYVGQASCLPTALQEAALWDEAAGTASVAEDVILALYLVDGNGLLDVRWQGLDAGSPQGALHPEGVLTQGASATSQSGLSGTGENSTGRWQPPEVRIVPSESIVTLYRFALDRELTMMKEETLKNHNFRVHNITVPVSCLAPSIFIRVAFTALDAFDGLVVNELAYTLRSRGYLERMDGSSKVEAWAWSAEQVEAANPKEGRSVVASFFRKVMIMMKSVIAFLLISAITGFFIRVAVNASAVLMFPLAAFAQSMGSTRLSTGVLTRSFPWIGVHVEVLRRAGRPLWPLFRSHIIFLMLQSFAYLSCNLAWRFILYRKSSPEGFEERIFSFCSILELFGLIFVRSANSIAVFPKLAFASMVYLHFYLFCSLYPFHNLALAICACVCGYVMAYCLNHFEEPALRADPYVPTTPTASHPRAMYMPQLSPSWTLESAPLWTMFYPLEPPNSFPEQALRAISNEEYLTP